MPPFVDDVQQTHPLCFAFQEDYVDPQGNPVRITTGHKDGLITLNLVEADSVHRELQRVQLGEPQRTLIGHLRHEAGHYIDWSWATRTARPEYLNLFGDPTAMDYNQALQRHYEQGPPADWESGYVSAYATMHPWEDFAETVNAYLDILAIAITAHDLGRSELDVSPAADADQLVDAVLEIVVEASEYNFDLGLLPLLPERFSPDRPCEARVCAFLAQPGWRPRR
jgi:hypothetical protein